MYRAVIRWVVIGIIALGFILFLVALATDSPLKVWVAPIWYGFIAISLIVAAVRRPRKRPGPAAELSASDGYSDLYLGRRAPTHYLHQPAPTSQIGDPPQSPHNA